MSKFYYRRKKMNCHFKTKYQVTPRCSHRAFSLPEAMAALMILSFMAVGVLTIVNRSMASVADSVLKMRAFEVARNNMEMLLASKSLSQTIDYGYSELYPQIEWENRVETFYEPVSSRLWLQAICSATYSDQQGEEQKIELTNWITEISKDDLLKLLKQEQKEYELTELIKTIAEAAQFAEVEPETIKEWLANDMPMVEEGDCEGYFIQSNDNVSGITGMAIRNRDIIELVYKKKNITE